MRIYFEKLLNRYYSLDVELEMINWFLKTGEKYTEYTSTWTKDGVSKQLFGYSANSHDASFPFPITSNNFIGNASFSFNVLNSFVQICLFNAILKSAPYPVNRWRKDERIELGKFRVLNFNTEYPNKEELNPKFETTYSSYRILVHKLKEYVGMPLKKEFCHPEYIDRIKPKITDINFYTNGRGYVFEYGFSFPKFNYESVWNDSIRQLEDESINCFLNRVMNEMDKRLYLECNDVNFQNATK